MQTTGSGDKNNRYTYDCFKFAFECMFNDWTAYNIALFHSEKVIPEEIEVAFFRCIAIVYVCLTALMADDRLVSVRPSNSDDWKITSCLLFHLDNWNSEDINSTCLFC